jgi:hypothetical protein
MRAMSHAVSSGLDVIRAAAEAAVAYAGTIDDRAVAPSPAALDALAAFDEPLPDGAGDGVATIELLAGWAGRRRWAAPVRTTSGS